VTALALTLAACVDDSACDATSALPVVSVDVAAFDAAHDLDALEVCMDGQCAQPGEPSEPLLFGRNTEARFLVPDGVSSAVPVDDTPTITLLVRTEAGEVLVPETTVELTRVHPGGEECGGGAWQGWYEATADGALVEDPDA
jgi:hypothetical protein